MFNKPRQNWSKPMTNIGVASKTARPVPNEQLEPFPTAWITHLQEALSTESMSFRINGGLKPSCMAR